MPSVSPSTASTLPAAAMVASRLVPAGMVWVMLTVFCPELSNRFVLSSGESIIVPANTANAATSVTILWFRAHFSAGRYAFCRCVSSFSSRWPTWRLESIHVATTGTTMSATTRLASRANVTVSANGRKNSEARPLTNPSGRKTATVVSVLAVIAPATSRVPVKAAERMLSPSCRCRWMFSITTMESSITRPMAMVSPPSVSMFSELPRLQRMISAPMMLSGMERPAMTVERQLRRNAQITMTANAAPMRPSRSRELMLSLTKTDWSTTVVTVA